MNQVATDKNRPKLIPGQLRAQAQMTPSSRGHDGTKTEVWVRLTGFPWQPRLECSVCVDVGFPPCYVVITANRIAIQVEANKKLLRWAVGGQTAVSIPGQPFPAEPGAATSFTH